MTDSSADQADQADQRSLSKGVWVNTVGIFARALRPLFLVIFSHSLGVEGFGLYMLGFAIQELVSKISMMGMTFGSMKILGDLQGAGKSHHIRKTLSIILLMGLGASVLASVLLYVMAPWLCDFILKTPELSESLKVFAWGVPGLTGAYILLHAIRPKLDMRYENLVRSLIEPLVVLVVGVILLNENMGVIGLAIAHNVSALAMLLLSLYFAHRLFPETTEEKIRIDWSTLFHASLGMGGMEFLSLFKFRLDLMVIGRFLPLSHVGAYAAVIEISGLLRKMRSAFLPVLMPLTQKLHIEGAHERLTRQVATSIRWSLIPSLAALGTMWLVPTAYLEAFGGDFTFGAVSLAILAVSQVLYVVSGMPEGVLSITGYAYTTLLNTIALVVVNLILLVLLVPIWGINGAAIATTISFFGQAVLLYIQSIRLLNVHPLERRQLKSLASFAIALLVGWLCGLLLPFESWMLWGTKFTFFLLVYVLGLFFFKAERSERNLIRWVKAFLSGIGRKEEANNKTSPSITHEKVER